MADLIQPFTRGLMQGMTSGGFSPLDQDGLALWLDAKQYSGLSTVAQWDDLSGNDQHMKLANKGVGPIYSTSNAVANSKPAMVWSNGSTAEHLIADLDVSYQDIYIVNAYKDGLDGTFDTFNCLVTGDDVSFGGPRIIGNGAGGTSNEVSANNVVDATPEKNGAAGNAVVLPMPLSVLRSTAGSVVTMRAIGTNFISGTTTPTTGRNWQGPICEVVAFSSTRTAEQNTELLNYFAARWGITLA